jgi:DNA-binding transcriptional regulator YdaS (Cro superfamily)
MILDTYLKTVESAVNLARKLGVAPVLISQWRTGRRPVPAKHCPIIERITNRQVRCEDLCPDVDWGFIRGTAPADKESA